MTTRHARAEWANASSVAVDDKVILRGLWVPVVDFKRDHRSATRASRILIVQSASGGFHEIPYWDDEKISVRRCRE